MVAGNSSKRPIVSVELTKDMLKELKKKHPSHGARSTLIRGLVQMYLTGKIPQVTYTETV